MRCLGAADAVAPGAAGAPCATADRAPRRAGAERWTTWALLGTTGALGLYAEENSKLGAALSSNVVTMVAAGVANLGGAAYIIARLRHRGQEARAAGRRGLALRRGFR